MEALIAAQLNPEHVVRPSGHASAEATRNHSMLTEEDPGIAVG
jgi:hypothetical protein